MYLRMLIVTVLLSSGQILARECDKDGLKLPDYLTMDYQHFDQTPPDGGWRGVAAVRCYDFAGELIDVYHLHHLESLNESQARVLFWHAGQMYALGGMESIAVSRFSKSVNPEEAPDDAFKWNAYVKGSIAFLTHDLDALQANRVALASASDPNVKVNLAILDRMIRCFDKTYAEIYKPGNACGD